MKLGRIQLHNRNLGGLSLGLLCLVVALPIATFPPARASAEPRKPCGTMRVLFLSDSHALGPFGEMLDTWLLGLPGAEVSTWAIGGSSPEWWFKGNRSNHAYAFHSCDGPPKPRKTLKHLDLHAPRLTEILPAKEGAYDRELVILGQGSNVPGTPAIYEALSAKLVKAVHDGRRPRTCVWIAPPKMRQWGPRYAEDVFVAIANGLRMAARDGAPCTLIDSRKYSDYPALEGDGVHYPFTRAGLQAARRWADGVIAELAPLVPPPPGAASARPPRGCRARPVPPDGE